MSVTPIPKKEEVTAETTTAAAAEKVEILEDTPSAVQKRREKEQADLAAKAKK
jgi:hypothetical protein